MVVYFDFVVPVGFVVYFAFVVLAEQSVAVELAESKVTNLTAKEEELKKALDAAEKAIQKSDIGINPNNDGKTLKLIFPPLTEERRKELAKSVDKYAEEVKVAISTIQTTSEGLEKYF